MAGHSKASVANKFEQARNVIVLHSNSPRPKPQTTGFDRQELDLLLQLYSRKVALGEWRDYAIDMLKDRAVFSVFKRSSEMPLFMIEKNPKLARRQGSWSVTNASGHILKRGHELRQVLQVLEKRPHLVSI